MSTNIPVLECVFIFYVDVRFNYASIKNVQMLRRELHAHFLVHLLKKKKKKKGLTSINNMYS